MIAHTLYAAQDLTTGLKSSGEPLIGGHVRGWLVVKEPHARVHHGDPVLAAGRLDLPVPGGAAGLGDVAHAMLRRVVDVVPERDEPVAGQRHVCQSGKPCVPSFGVERGSGPLERRRERRLFNRR